MGTYNFTGSAKYVTVASTGEYDITAYGAQGGAASSESNIYIGGYGAETGGLVQLTEGEKLEIVVGGRGGTGGFLGGGGGGGSFVLTNVGGTYQPLIVAGGGGGGADFAGGDALTSNGDGQGGAPSTSFTGRSSGGGGSGVKSSGGDSPNAQGGSNRSGSYAGGNGNYHDRNGSNGGFGGGGAGAYGGGGGGGYSGGYGGAGGTVVFLGAPDFLGLAGGGGCSFDGGTPIPAQTIAHGNAGDGRVIISELTVCFASGTRVSTARGNIEVEALQVGELVVTASGALRPITWLGHRIIDCRRHPRPHKAMPVRIAAHAFGENRPARDLVVSPGHSICVDLMGETLIPAGILENGTTIRREDVDSVTYWHVELDSHDILLAENLLCESYLEIGNRGFFADGGVVALGAGPDALMRTHADFCRPFVDSGPQLEAVKARLKKRAVRYAASLHRETSAAGA